MPDTDPNSLAESFTDTDMKHSLDGINKIEEAWNNAKGEAPLNFRYEFNGERVNRRNNVTKVNVCYQ